MNLENNVCLSSAHSHRLSTALSIAQVLCISLVCLYSLGLCLCNVCVKHVNQKLGDTFCTTTLLNVIVLTSDQERNKSNDIPQNALQSRIDQTYFHSSACILPRHRSHKALNKMLLEVYVILFNRN